MSLTTLNEDLDLSETGVDVTPALTAQNRPAMVLIDSELFSVSAGTSTLTVTRGANGTTAATHTNTTKVFQVEKVDYRGDSLFVYYYGDDGALAGKRIVVTGDTINEIPSASGKDAGSVITVDSTGAYVVGAPQNGLYAVDGVFTESAGAGTYTIQVPVKSGTRLLDIIWHTTAVWAATTTLLKVGRSGGTDNAFMTAANVDAADTSADSHPAVGTGWGTNNEGILAGGKAGYVFTADENIDMIIVTTGTGGATGITRVSLLLAYPQTVLVPTKA